MSDPSYPAPPDPDFAASEPQPPVREAVPDSGPPWTTIIAVSLLVVLGVVLFMLITGNTDDPAASPSPGASGSAVAPSGSPSLAASVPASGSATGSTAPSAAASEPSSPTAVEPPDGILPMGSVVEVIGDGLRLREEPTTGGAEVATLAAGEVLYLMVSPDSVGPIEADGFSWYLGMNAPGYRDWPLNPPGSGDGPSGDPRVSGWFAAGSAEEDFVELLPARCPVGTDIDALYGATAWERLACLDDQQVTTEGTFGCGGCGGLMQGTFEPQWLAAPSFNIFTPPWADLPPVVEQMVIHVPPDIPQLGTDQAGSVLRVTGHFNDPRSVDCVLMPGEPGSERQTNDLAAEWYCRIGFVVESWEVIGTDPDWQGG